MAANQAKPKKSVSILTAGQSGSGTSALALHLDRLEAKAHNPVTYTAMSFQDRSEETILPPCEGMILTVNLMEGPMPGTREAIRLAHGCGIPIVGICLTHLDTFDAQTRYTPAIKELEAWETRELLSEYGYNDDEIPLTMLSLVTGCEPEAALFREKVLAYFQKQ